MADDEAPEPSPDERRLWRWRYRVALEAGLPDPDASLFADAALDSHALVDLVERGCEPATALRILL